VSEQHVVVLDGVVVEDLGERAVGSQPGNSEVGRAHYEHGAEAVIAAVETGEDRLLDVGDRVDVDSDGVATLVEEVAS